MKNNIVVLGPNPSLYGGISQYVSGILNSPLKDRYNLMHCEIGIGKYGKPGFIHSVIRMLKQLFNFFNILNAKKVSLVHIHTASWRSFWRYSFFMFLLKLCNRKVVLHMHGAKFKEFYLGHSFLGRYLVRSVLEISDTMILLSQIWFSFFDKVVPSISKAVIEPTVPMAQEDFLKFDPSMKYNHENSKVKVLYFGGISERKGLRTIIESSQLLRNQPRIHFTVAGAVQKSELSLAKDLIINSQNLGDKFKIIFDVDNKEKIKLFSESHIYILPSFAEGLPATLMEAMSYQLPVITTPVGSIPEVIGKRNGILIDPSNSSELAHAISKLSGDFALCKDMGLANQKKVIRDFNYLDMFKKIDTVYQSQF